MSEECFNAGVRQTEVPSPRTSLCFKTAAIIAALAMVAGAMQPNPAPTLAAEVKLHEDRLTLLERTLDGNGNVVSSKVRDTGVLSAGELRGDALAVKGDSELGGGPSGTVIYNGGRIVVGHSGRDRSEKNNVRHVTFNKVAHEWKVPEK